MVIPYRAWSEVAIHVKIKEPGSGQEHHYGVKSAAQQKRPVVIADHIKGRRGPNDSLVYLHSLLVDLEEWCMIYLCTGHMHTPRFHEAAVLLLTSINLPQRSVRWPSQLYTLFTYTRVHVHAYCTITHSMYTLHCYVNRRQIATCCIPWFVFVHV